MKKLLLCFFLMVPTFVLAESSFYDFKVKNIDGKQVALGNYKNKVVLLANTASKCGFTPQYQDLQDLYKSHADKGFVVLGFPSNDFGDEKNETNSDIKKFCSFTYGVTFPLFAKSVVSGKDKQPFFAWLTNQDKLKGEIEWNFEKFLLDKKGQLRARFGSQVNPASRKIVSKVDELIAE